MEVWLWGLVGVLVLIIVVLLIKIYLLQKSAEEIEEALADRLMTNTNTLIDIASRDRYMRRLAGSINTQLRKLRGERQRFQQGDLEIKETITNISHDLRTPLTAICGYLDLLEREEKSETVTRYLEVIDNRAEVLKHLTEELFRYSIVISTSNDTDNEYLDLNSVLEESISAYYAALKKCQITPVISIPETKIRRNLNKNALSRILENVLSNAVKYSDGDLHITLCENGEIIFSNNASGLDEIEVGKLSDRFYTVITARKSTGLGLAIAKTLTEQMNGSFTAQYADGIISIHILFQEAANY